MEDAVEVHVVAALELSGISHDLPQQMEFFPVFHGISKFNLSEHFKGFFCQDLGLGSSR